MARPEKKITDEIRNKVRTMAAYGMPQDVIGELEGFSPKTLRKHFRRELDLAHHQANAEMAGYLFKAGKEGNVTAQIFWLKTRGGWREINRTEHSGPDAGPIVVATDAERVRALTALLARQQAT